MDYWEYIAHSQGSERSGHRYYARELVGNKGGKNVYRYFYTAEEYAAYKNNKGTPGRGTYAENGTSRNATIWPKGTAKARARAEARNHVEQEKNAMDRARANRNVRAEKVKMDAERYRKQRSAETRARGKAERIGEQHSMDRQRWKRNADEAAANEAWINRTLRGHHHKRRVQSAIADKVKKDAEAYRTKRRAAQVKKDAEAYRKKRRDAAKAKRIGEQHSMDRKRWSSQNATRIGEEHSADMAKKRTEALAAQVKKDARAYRRKKANQSVRRKKVRMDAKRTRAKKRETIRKNRDFVKRVMDNTRGRKSYQPTIV